MTDSITEQATVRHAIPDQRATMIEVLSEAFHSDPMMALLFPDEHNSALADKTRLTALMENEVDRHLPLGHSYIVDDLAAALWTPPGIDAESEEFALLVNDLAGADHMAPLFPQFIEMMQWKPDEPHFYLHVIGAVDRARGKGYGSLLLRRVTDVCDREGFPAYLEASTARSAALYARHGFEEMAVINFAPGVALRPMLRPAA
jgi:GNAT superfamily N-acetyltransferase